MSLKGILDADVKVVNVGVPAFGEAVRSAGAEAVQVEWRPPLDVPEACRRALHASQRRRERANAEALERILSAAPQWVGMGRAMDLIPGMHENLLLHAGPPITWDRMCGPLQGAILGALLYERRASSIPAARRLAASGKIQFAPCHEHGATGPMAGVVSPSMPVFIIRNATYGNRAFATMNEGLGKVLRYGAYGSEVLERLRWMETEMYPVLRAAIEHLGAIDLKHIMAQALHMGDELHNRNRAATSLLYRLLAPAIVRTCADSEAAARVLEFIHGNDHFFLNLSMPAGKATLDPARGISGSSLCVVMARNGTEFGIQVAGTGSAWFTGPAAVPDALFFPGYTRKDANPDIGDSAITETYGLGGFAIAAAPAIVQFVGGTAGDAMGYTQRMYEITAGESRSYQIPALDFRGTPTGIDVVKVVEKNILPFIDTGVAHRKPGVGQIGAGVLNAPPEPFQRAYEGLANAIKKKG